MNRPMTALALVMMSSPALAQTGTTPTVSAADPVTPQDVVDPTKPVDEGQDRGLSDIVVTAERRSSTVQKSSLSIEAFSGEALASVTSPSDLTELTPGIQVANGGPFPQVYIRGVGDAAANSRNQGAVAFNVDGVYISRPTQIAPLMIDVSRLEVLKGPQGTLYGRNAAGGAVNVITTNPSLQKVEGYVGAEVGNYDLRTLNGAINAPLSSTVAIRVAGQVTDRDGYTSNGGQDQVYQAGRVKLLWEPSATVSLLLSADVSHIGGEGSGLVLNPAPNGERWRDLTQTPLAYPFLFNANTAPFTAPDDRFVDSDTYGFSAEFNADLGFATLTLLPAFRKQDIQSTSYTYNYRFYEALDDEQLSMEARLGNDSDVLDWTLGLYYFSEKQDVLLSPFSQGRLAGVRFDQKTTAYAIFGQATYSITDRLRAIGGLRYTEEEITGEFQQGVAGPPRVAFTSANPVVRVNPLKVDQVNYKVGAEFDLAPDSLLFATYGTGFKGGGFVQTLFCNADQFGPEKVNALTVGSRNRFANNRVQLNIEGFRWKYKDQQVSFVGLDTCGGTTFLTRNPGDATIQGANVDLVLRLSRNDTLRGAVEYTDASYDNFLLTLFGTGAYGPTSGTRCGVSPAAAANNFNVNCAGQPLPRTPKWTGQAGYEHSFPLASGAEVAASTDIQFATARWLDTSFLPNGRDGAYGIWNAQLQYTHADGAWTLTGYVNNITDTLAFTGGQPVAANAPNGFRYFSANPLSPRTYGVRARFNF